MYCLRHESLNQKVFLIGFGELVLLNKLNLIIGRILLALASRDFFDHRKVKKLESTKSDVY